MKLALGVLLAFSALAPAPLSAQKSDRSLQDLLDEGTAILPPAPLETNQNAQPKRPSVVVEVTKDNFKAEVYDSPIPVIIDWGAAWCGHCNDAAPAFEEAARQFVGKVKFCRIDSDKETDLGKIAKIRLLPTFDFIKNRKFVHRETGTPGSDPDYIKKYIVRLVEEYLLKP